MAVSATSVGQPDSATLSFLPWASAVRHLGYGGDHGSVAAAAAGGGGGGGGCLGARCGGRTVAIGYGEAIEEEELEITRFGVRMCI
jgi:hypothetical protein